MPSDYFELIKVEKGDHDLYRDVRFEYYCTEILKFMKSRIGLDPNLRFDNFHISEIKYVAKKKNMKILRFLTIALYTMLYIYGLSW